MNPEPLKGGTQTMVRRVGGAVLRSANPWSPSVIALLRHLSDAGFSASPRPIGSGFDEHGNEMLSFLKGQSPHPRAWSDAAIHEVGALVRTLHRAASAFVAPEDAPWQPGTLRTLGNAQAGYGHGDLGPWNIIAVDGMPVGFIDWDTSGPMDPLWDLAYAAWLNAQLHDDALAEKLELGTPTDRARQLALLVDGYELPGASRKGFVDKMIEVAVHSARTEALRYHVTADTKAAVAPDGFPVLWSLTWRIQSASWMFRNRATLENALTSA